MAHIIKFCSQAYHHAGNGQNVTKPAHFWTFDESTQTLQFWIQQYCWKDVYLDCLQFFLSSSLSKQSKFLKIIVNLSVISYQSWLLTVVCEYHNRAGDVMK